MVTSRRKQLQKSSDYKFLGVIIVVALIYAIGKNVVSLWA